MNPRIPLTIEPPILKYAELTAANMTPLERQSGWSELPTEKRGQGDLLDLIGSLVFFHELGRRNKICSVDLTSGMGDDKDITVRIGGEFKAINIKTSSYHPIREDLRLFVKEEELKKDIDAYVQCFVHLNSHLPHVHLAGWVATSSKLWKEAEIDVIPNTGGHRGFGIPISKLGDIDKLYEMIDGKF